MPRHVPMAIPSTSVKEIWEYVTRILTPDVSKQHVELGFNSEPANDTVAVDTETALTEGEITIALPDGAVVKKASLLALLIYQQNGTTQIDVNVDIFLAKSAEAYGNAVLSLSPGFGLPEYTGTSGELIVPVDVSAKVDAVGDYKCQVKVTQSAANSVQYVTAFVLIVSYSMS